MIRTLIVEDDPLIAEAHRAYLDRVPGFGCAGVAHDGGTALRLVAERPTDLVLLDMGLPDMSGLDVLRALRARSVPVDVIAVTSARELDVVRSAVSGGVVQYLLKPFSFAALRDKLERYADYRASLSGTTAAQGDIDRALGALRGSTQVGLPKGLAPQTLALVISALRGAAEPRSARDVAADLGVSRVTARRYLEHLADTDTAVRTPRYGAGRPEHLYRWA